MIYLIYFVITLIVVAVVGRLVFRRRRRRFAREYARLSKLFESGQWPEPGTIVKGEVKR